jgi:hypothetical protein
MNNMMKEMKSGVFTYGGESYEFNFATSLSAYEKLTFVKMVSDTIVDDGEYHSIVKDLIFDFSIVSVFTNIDTSFIYMEDDDGNDINPIVLIEHFLGATNVVDIVKANMEDGLIDELNRAVNLNIQYRTGINTNPLYESIARLVSVIEKKVDEFDLDGVMDMAQKLSGMTEGFTVENIVEAYMNSNARNNNLIEISEDKN